LLKQVYTIGVYGFTPESFFQALRDAGVDTLCDIRLRRGVRGAEYAFANSLRLQDALARRGIRYRHWIELAPALELRKLQYASDRETKTAKRQRQELCPEYIERYSAEYLRSEKFQPLLEALEPEEQVIALFCVETEPAACHRSLVAKRLGACLGLEVQHLMP